jgi:hypothetical protein
MYKILNEEQESIHDKSPIIVILVEDSESDLENSDADEDE